MKTTLPVWLCVLSALTAPPSDATPRHFSVSVPSEPISVRLGDSVILPCSVTPPVDVHDLEVRWYRPTKFNPPVLLYKEQQLQTSSLDPQYRGRVSLDLGTEGLARGNLSLHLRNITARDVGEYVCYVSSDQWYEMGQVSLHLKNLVGSIPVLSVQPSNGDRGGAQPQMPRAWCQ
ncbi:butyrophilin subfamily 1 member A1-like [Megalops cyprinoides]|uniref:butyrophilin subfamily 1 member A1-like n=1 Tax=Megalops cyprinoides TaxID=118141 RepID=UPI001864ED30|nr:butyrophilin subfamily 1 member A1-like [Megalops cyprinoides]